MQTKESAITRNLARGVQQPEKSGTNLKNDDHERKVMVIANQGEKISNMMETLSSSNTENLSEGRENNVDSIKSNGLIILDTKRRRTEKPSTLDQTDDQAQVDEEIVDSQKRSNSNKKLECGGFCSQARLSL